MNLSHEGYCPLMQTMNAPSIMEISSTSFIRENI